MPCSSWQPTTRMWGTVFHLVIHELAVRHFGYTRITSGTLHDSIEKERDKVMRECDARK